MSVNPTNGNADTRVEVAALRSQPAEHALARAPQWVRDRVARLREERGGPVVVERRSEMEFSSMEGRTSIDSIEQSLRNAPASVVRRVNAARRARGLSEVSMPQSTASGLGVWVVRDGRLVPATNTSPRRPTSRSASTTVTRVLILPTYGMAPAANVRGRLPEMIAPGAFGRVADINRDREFDLRHGHQGPRLAMAGERLIAHDTPHGLVVEWLLDDRAPAAGEVLRALERGPLNTSVAMKIVSTRRSRLPAPTTLVTEARLMHVAILPADERPCYTAGVAMLFRHSRQGDAGELRKQIDKLVDEARFRSWRSRQ